MDDAADKPPVERATLFQSGFLIGFRQFEVRQLRACVVPIRSGGEYDAVRFIERGIRKERVLPLRGLLVLDGWGYPLFERIVDTGSNGIVAMGRAKFSAFSPEWDVLLNDYLRSHNLQQHIIVDGRNRADLVRRRKLSAPLTTQPSAVLPAETESTPAAATTQAEQPLPPAAFTEGELQAVELDRFERDPAARAACLGYFGYRCQVCRVLMSDVYGVLGEKYNTFTTGHRYQRFVRITSSIPHAISFLYAPIVTRCCIAPLRRWTQKRLRTSSVVPRVLPNPPLQRTRLRPPPA